MDTGLHGLVALARFHQLPAGPDQIAHQSGQPGQNFSAVEILQAAKELTLKARQLSLDFNDLDNATQEEGDAEVLNGCQLVCRQSERTFFQILRDKMLDSVLELS